MNEIVNNLEELRVELGLTQQDAAMLIGVSRATYLRYENDIGTMPIGRYEDLMVAFDRLKQLKEGE